MAIAVEVTRPDLFPTRPGIGAHRGTAAADYARPVHFPDCGLAIRVLPKDVGMTVGIEVTRDDMVGDIGGELVRQGGRMDRVKEQIVLIVRTQTPGRGAGEITGPARGGYVC